MLSYNYNEKDLPYLHPRTPSHPTSIKLACIYLSKNDFISLYQTHLPLQHKKSSHITASNSKILNPEVIFTVPTSHRSLLFAIKRKKYPYSNHHKTTQSTQDFTIECTLTWSTYEHLLMRMYFNLTYIQNSTSKNNPMYLNPHTHPQTLTPTHMYTN